MYVTQSMRFLPQVQMTTFTPNSANFSCTIFDEGGSGKKLGIGLEVPRWCAVITLFLDITVHA